MCIFARGGDCISKKIAHFSHKITRQVCGDDVFAQMPADELHAGSANASASVMFGRRKRPDSPGNPDLSGLSFNPEKYRSVHEARIRSCRKRT